MTSRKLPDLIEAFMEYTEGEPTPDVFRHWGGIFMVSAALSRRVWTNSAEDQIYPTLFVILVGDSGVGKGPTMKPVEAFLRTIDYGNNPILSRQGINLGAEYATAAGCFDQLMDDRSTKSFKLDGEEFEFKNLTVVVEEGATFLSPLGDKTQGLPLSSFLINQNRHKKQHKDKPQKPMYNPNKEQLKQNKVFLLT